MEQLTLSCYDVEMRVVDAAGVGVCGRLLDTLPPQFVAVPDGGSPSTTYHVEAVTKDGRPAWRVTRDGDTLVCEEAFASDLPHYLRQDIDQCVAQRASRMLFVHAGVIGWRGYAIVIPGRSRTGKSTLVAALVRRGAVYYSDEYAVFDDQGRVHPYSRVPVFRDDGTAADLRLVREDEPLRPLPLALTVAGDYRPGVAWRPTVVLGARAVLPLIDGTVLAREASTAMLQMAARIGPDAIALMGPRPDAAEVAPQLLELVDDAIVSRGLGVDIRSSEGIAADLAGVAARRFQSRGIRRPPPTDRRLRASRYVRMLDFLSPDEHQRLLEHALACQGDFGESGIVGQRGENTLNYGARRSRTLMGGRLEEVWDIFERRLNGILPGVRKAVGAPYFRLGEVERQLTAHGTGGFFVPHTDTGHPVAATRRISAVYYFHRQPQRFSGGQLRLYDTWVTPSGSTGAGTYTTLAPVDNSLVFFPSDAFHEVCVVNSESDAFADSRFTVTIWFHEQPAPVLVPRAVSAAAAAQTLRPGVGDRIKVERRSRSRSRRRRRCRSRKWRGRGRLRHEPSASARHRIAPTRRTARAPFRRRAASSWRQTSGRGAG